MNPWPNFFRNLLTAFISVALVFGGLEMGFRTFSGKRVETYFDQQTELVLGYPVPRKKADEYRIFILGGSAAYGFPLADHHSIAAWLRKSFPLLIPGKKVRVINAAWPGKGSHHVLEGVSYILKYQPDLFIIYSGHNEFPTTNRLYLDNVLYLLNLKITFRSTFYRFLVNRFHRLRKHLVYGSSGYAEKAYREEVIAQKVYHRADITDGDYVRILRRYRENMEKAVHSAHRHKIDVVFLTLPSNLRDIPPTMSSNSSDLSTEKLTEWARLYETGKDHEEKKQWEQAVKLYESAARLDPTHAELEYRLGRSYEEVGRFDEARTAYTQARDFDRAPWRARSSMNDAIRDLSRTENAILVDIDSTFAHLSPHGIIASDLIHDNVHPSFKGQLLIADEILQALWKNGLIVSSREWQWESLRAARSGPESDAWKTETDFNAYQYILTGMHLWGQRRYAESATNLEKGLEIMPRFIESYAFLGDDYVHLDQKGKAAQAFRSLQEKDAALSESLLKRYPEIQESYRQIIRS